MIRKFAVRFSPTSMLGFKAMAAALLLGLTGFIAGCGGGGGGGGVAAPTPTVTSITVSTADPNVAVGSTSQFTATGVYSDGSKSVLSSGVTWSSSAPTVATINSAGLATAVAAGPTTITAMSAGVSGTAPLTVTGATLVSIGVTPAMPSVAQGTPKQFTAMGVYSDNSTQNLTSKVTWASSATSVATINAAGLASTVGVGPATISATFGTVKGSTTLTVTAATLVSIAVTPANASLAKGLTETLTATGTYSNNTQQNITSLVTWSSSNPTIAAVSASGGNEIATAVSVGGPVTLTATLGSVSGTTPLTVTAATVVSIAVTPTTPSIANGLTQQFAATGTYSDGSMQTITNTVAWTSSIPTVASISNATGSEGLAQALTQGSTTITAALSGVTGTATLTVNPATLVSIAVTGPTSVINGASVQLTATGTYTDNSTQNLTATAAWASSNTGVATVSNATGSQGLATGVTTGPVQITAAVGTISSPATGPGSFTLTVTPAEYAYVANYGAGTVSQYLIGTGGALVAMSTATVAAGTHPFSIAVDGTQHYAYVANYGSANVSEYVINSDGSLSPNTTAATVAVGTNPNGITANGAYVYVANYGSATVSQFSIQGDGSLQSLTPATVAAGNGAATVTFNPAGTYAYVPNFVDGTISEYSVAAGVLSPTGTQTLALGSDPNSIAIDPTGTYLYVSDYYANNILQFSIAANGSLTPLATSTLPTGGNPRYITLFTLSGNDYYYAPNSASNAVYQFSAGTGGSLTASGTTTLAAGSAPNFIAFDATGQYAYVADRGTSLISQYSVGALGALTPLSTPTATPGTNPTAIATSTAY